MGKLASSGSLGSRLLLFAQAELPPEPGGAAGLGREAPDPTSPSAGLTPWWGPRSGLKDEQHILNHPELK